jgi:hypothetical protein
MAVITKSEMPGLSVMRAVVIGNVELVTQWLDMGGARSKSDSYLGNMMCVAARNGHDDICQLMIDSELLYGINGALRLACRFGYLSTVHLLVSSIDQSDLKRCIDACLIDASTAGQTDTVSFLANVMKMSEFDRIRWMLVTASGQGDRSHYWCERH